MKKITLLGLFCLITVFQQSLAQAPVFHNPAQVLQAIHQQKEIGKGVYDAFCGVCHAPQPLIQVGAPRKGVKADWQWRRQQRNAKQMLEEIDSGMNNMPPRGGCFECSDEDLLAAIRYLFK